MKAKTATSERLTLNNPTQSEQVEIKTPNNLSLPLLSSVKETKWNAKPSYSNCGESGASPATSYPGEKAGCKPQITVNTASATATASCCCCCRPHSTNVLPAESSTQIMWQPTVSPPRWQGKAPLCQDSSRGPG